MKKLTLLFIIIFSLQAYSYEVGTSYVSISPSYQRGDFHSKIENNKLNSYYDEKIKDINWCGFCIEGQMSFFDNFLLQMHGNFAFGSSHRSHLNLNIPVGERPFQLTAPATFAYDTDSFRWKIGTKLGYHYRLGAIVFQPKIGFVYNDLKLKRHKISPYPFRVQQLTTSAAGTIFPYNDIDVRWYTPIFGLDLIFLIDPNANWNLLACYEYLIGPAHFSTYYLHNEIATTPTSRKMLFYKEKQKSTKAGDGHFLDLSLRYGVSRWFFFGLGFQYEHFRIFSGNIKDEYNGYFIENNIRTNNSFNLKPRLSDLRFQSFNFYISLAVEY